MPPALGRSPRQESPVRRGWSVVLASVIGLSFSTGTTLIYTFGVFAKPLAAELKTGLGPVALPMSVIDLGMALTAAPWGRAIDRYGARRGIATSLICLAACVAVMACIRPPLWHLYLVYLFAGVTTAGTTSIGYSRAVSDSFDRRRGLALAVANSGLGLGAFVTPLLAQYVIERAGLRFAYLALAAACLLIALPAALLLLGNKPPEQTTASSGSPSPEAFGLNLTQALRTRAFWQLALIFLLVGAGINGASAHLVPILTQAGVNRTSAALAASVFGATIIAGRLLSGLLVDRNFAPWVAATLFGTAGLGVLLLWTSSAGSAFFLAAVLLGIGAGAEGDLMPYLVSRYFGLHAMAELYGLLFGAFTIGNAAGRYLLAAGFDAFHSYRTPLPVVAAAISAAVVGCLLLGPYPAPCRYPRMEAELNAA